MSTKSMNLNKKCFFVLSGVSNALGKHLALEMCGRIEDGSLVLLIDVNEENLQEIRKDIVDLEKDINVICYNLMDWQKADNNLFRNLLKTVLSLHQAKAGGSGIKQFDFALIVHNEANAATRMLMEPQDIETWKDFAQQYVNAPVALSQEFLQSQVLKGIPKVSINIKSSLIVQPFVFSSLRCSCAKARDMYFRSMATEEAKNDVVVLSYAPGILETHTPEYDCNNNVIDVCDVLGENKNLAKLPRVGAQQTTLKLINILEKKSFISGHDVDYYDTFVL